MPKSTQDKPTLSISAQMTTLGELVEKLEDPEIELEAALVLYEQGIALSASIQKTLETAEQRVAQVAANGSLLEEEDSPGEH